MRQNARRAATVLLVAGCVAYQAQGAAIAVPQDVSTISAALLKASAGDTVWVANGVYRERILLPHDVALMARVRFGAVIDGGGRGTVVTMGKNSCLVGFEVRNGTIGIFNNGAGNAVRFCRIVRNWQTGIVCVRHLPIIEDNIIAFNGGSGFQGWDVRSSTATINHNTIAFNANHGISVGGSSNFVVENNVIAFNERFGTHIHEESEKGVRVSNNNFFQNLSQRGGVPQGNFSFDPAFISPRRTMNFNVDPKRCCTIKGTDNENLGVRLSY